MGFLWNRKKKDVKVEPSDDNESPQNTNRSENTVQGSDIGIDQTVSTGKIRIKDLGDVNALAKKYSSLCKNQDH